MDRIVRRLEVAKLLGVAVATVDSWVQRGRLERPIQLSANAVGWKLSTIEEFIEEARQRPYHRNGRGRPRAADGALSSNNPTSEGADNAAD